MNRIIREDMERLCANAAVPWEKFRGKTFLVTGAYGMLPSYAVFALLHLNDKGYGVRILAQGRSREKFLARFGAYVGDPALCFVGGDVSQGVPCSEKPDYIIHGASLASSQHYGTRPVDVILPNVIGTYYTLELARKFGAQAYVFLSSGEIYGKVDRDVVDESYCGPLDPSDVRSCYGESKRMGENLCVAYCRQYGVPARIVRLAHTYGPTMDLENDRRVFSEFVSDVVHGQDIFLKSDGRASRTFCYLSDAMLGLFLVLTKGADGEAYNLCNAEGGITIGDLAELLTRMFPEKRLRVVRSERKDAGYLASPVRAAPVLGGAKLSTLGMEYHVSVEEGFRRTVENFYNLRKR
jgi:UDP-glucuronate decarboxylase